MFKKLLNKIFDWVFWEDYPGYEETGLTQDEWDNLPEEQKEKIREMLGDDWNSR